MSSSTVSQHSVAFMEYAHALVTHDAAISDPSRNVATGRALYEAEVRLKEAAREFARMMREETAAR